MHRFLDPGLLDRLLDKADQDAAEQLFEHLTKHNYKPDDARWVKEAKIHKAHVPLARVKLTGKPNDPEKVDRMVRELKSGEKLPRVFLADLGSGPLRIADGHHRVFASKRADLHTIRAYVITHVTDDPKEPWRVMHDKEKGNEKAVSEGMKKGSAE